MVLSTPPDTIRLDASLERLQALVRQHPRLLVLTGAGISTDSGIPGYRDADGQWRGNKPIQYKDFVSSHATRQRYWARSMAGWPLMSRAQPNAAHLAVAGLQRAGQVEGLVTQNVDGLHQRAGSTDVIELHGSIGSVVCLECRRRYPRADIQARLERDNPGFIGGTAAPAADGDAHVEREDLHTLRVPVCTDCAGMLKPDVVFFGESVPRERVDAVRQALDHADMLLVVGSSLMVYSGYRFCLHAAQLGKPVVAINLGRTRADDLLTLKVAAPCASVLAAL
ncbi:NAD-dependent protein deacetylase [Cupriavidus respiraculi]|uniref:NAD-dependent protein deacetylase n=1 Tax=Cupriavidus respiraculi TaxID=195930 RepID=UPI001C96EB0A|nr:NAD-dependent protein deacetylase [Cupriavidus respiraculi]MBY4945584.1 NAD-dependent protein deacetylase [Cupriavidus respiraculi]